MQMNGPKEQTNAFFYQNQYDNQVGLLGKK
jgi:hypothetical protein